jgi:hypothetical protein
MRALSLALLLSVLTIFPTSGNAGDARPFQIAAASDGEKVQLTNPNNETYRGHFLDLSSIARRQDFAVMADTLRHQVDIVENVGVSPRVLEFFRTIPISVNEVACLNLTHTDGKYSTDSKDSKDSKEDPKVLLHAACYGQEPAERSQSRNHGSVWNSEKFQWTNPDPVALAEDTQRGVVLVRPIMLDASAVAKRYAQQPVILHELLHAYHANIMPQGIKNPGVLLHYNLAKSGNIYPPEAYLLTNEKEFFAVTASVFLYGNAHEEPGTGAKLKEKQPDYYQYLVWLFGFDPDLASATPVASAD